MPYLNAAPLTAGLGSGTVYLPPSHLARELHAGRLDAALVSITEVLREPGYEVLDGWGIGSEGDVFSVILAHREPLDQVRVIHVDPASCTSVNLLRVLLAERGIVPELRPLHSYVAAPALTNVLLIGNAAIDFRRAGHDHAIWDLGGAWYALTGLPFVFAAWALRCDPDDRPTLRALLRRSAEGGLDGLEEVVRHRTEYDAPFRQVYLGGHIRYRMDDRHWDGVECFAAMMQRHLGIPSHPLRRG